MSLQLVGIYRREAGLSDHQLLQWSIPVSRPDQPIVTVNCRPWHQLDVDKLLKALRGSRLFVGQGSVDWQTAGSAVPLMNSFFVWLYDNELELLLDSLIPVKTITCRRRPSDPWFDPECRQAKRRVRHLERRISANNATDAFAEWMKDRSAYRSLLR